MAQRSFDLLEFVALVTGGARTQLPDFELLIQWSSHGTRQSCPLSNKNCYSTGLQCGASLCKWNLVNQQHSKQKRLLEYAAYLQGPPFGDRELFNWVTKHPHEVFPHAHGCEITAPVREEVFLLHHCCLGLCSSLSSHVLEAPGDWQPKTTVYKSSVSISVVPNAASGGEGQGSVLLRGAQFPANKAHR